MRGIRVLPLLILLTGLLASLPIARAQQTTNGEPSAKVTATAPARAPTTAERIIDLKSVIAKSEAALADLEAQLEDPRGERADAEDEFTALDEQFNAKQAALAEARAADDAEQVAALEDDVAQLQERRDLARQRFDLALDEQAALREQIQTLETRLQQDRLALERLQAPPATQPASVEETAAPDATTPGESRETAAPAAPMPGIAPTVPTATTDAEAPKAPTEEEPVSEEVVRAREVAEEKKAAAVRAEAEVTSIAERITTLENQIDSKQKLLETAREKVRVAGEQQETLTAQIREQRQAGAAQADIAALRKELEQAQDRAAEAELEIIERQTALDELQTDLADLQAEQSTAREAAESRREEAEAATQEVESLENPFHPDNLLRWLIDHGPRILGILLGAFLLIWITKVFERRLVKMLVGRKDHGSRVERENRASTLAAVFRNVAYIAIIVGCILMILAEIDVQIGPLLGGAAVIGLAVAFGAQSLVKDYFYGFIILLENQYTVNDVIKIGDTAGLVERITLRMTVLRDLEGIVHFVPHGEATRVSNLTHGWSRTVLDIGVSYNENADHVMEVLEEVGKELYEDPDFRPLMISAPEILGLDAFADSAIVIKLLVKTRPLQQWTIKRQYLRRIKKRFDEVGIEIPFPHRTVYHRWEDGQRLTLEGDGGGVAALSDRHRESRE